MSTSDFYKRETLIQETTPATDRPPESLPKKIGAYKIESLLNKGGMSLLYLGIHPETHEPVAVKVLSSKYVSHAEMVERFFKEASIIEITNHPNIVQLFGQGKWEGGVYIAMEFIQGISLRQMILQEAMSLKRSLEIVLQISYALLHLHSHGIIHRDLKPENILLTAQGGVKVIDFGISQLYTEKAMEREQRLLGTPVYMSPEQRENPQNVSFATDIYALGIITYELVLGKLSHGVIHLSMMPRGLQKILAKALQPKPEERYEDVIDFVYVLSGYLASEELKKDMRGSDYLGELNENLKDAQVILIPKALPRWPRFEMALSSNASTAVSSVYYDFFQTRENVFNIVMGESLKTGVEGLLHIAILKGMVRALSGNSEGQVTFVQHLNARIFEANLGEHFSFALLALYPAEERLSYISCGYTPLWFLPSGADTPRRLTADNPPLGSDPTASIIEVDNNFNIGDTAILHTFQAGSAKSVAEINWDEEQFVDALKENLFLSVPKQIEAIFRRVSQNEARALTVRPVTVIGIERLD
jgi:serine/threonine protein kinase